MIKSVKVRVLDVYLDSENPRHKPLSDQSKIIENLIKKEQIKKLAKDIAENGVSPLETTALIKDENDKYVVVEGNRRTCALRLLNDPKSAPDAHKSYFSKLSENSEVIPSRIECKLFESREEADIWIERRHSGAQEGIGAKQWNSDQKTRFNTRRSKADSNALAVSILDYAASIGVIPQEREDKILTTASRFLGNPYFRNTLGVVSSRSDPDIMLNVRLNEFEVAVTYFCKDLIDPDPKSAVSSRTNKAQWEAYAKKMLKQGVAPSANVEKYKLREALLDKLNGTDSIENGSFIDNADNGVSEIKSIEEVNNSDTSSPDVIIAPTNVVASNKNPDQRKYIVPHNFHNSIRDRILRRVFQEMKEIEIDQHTLSVALLSRAFLENLYSIFHEKVLGNYIKAQTHIVMNKIITHIEQDKSLTKSERQALGALKRVQANENNVLSPKTLGANAHASHYPNSKELKREWDNIASIIEYMLKRI